jgi:DNA helicase-2/ATP-dependent DNA helicase PcrA
LRIEPEVADLRPGFDILDADDTRGMIKRVMKAMNLANGEEEGSSVAVLASKRSA